MAQLVDDDPEARLRATAERNPARANTNIACTSATDLRVIRIDLE